MSLFRWQSTEKFALVHMEDTAVQSASKTKYTRCIVTKLPYQVCRRWSISSPAGSLRFPTLRHLARWREATDPCPPLGEGREWASVGLEVENKTHQFLVWLSRPHQTWFYLVKTNRGPAGWPAITPMRFRLTLSFSSSSLHSCSRTLGAVWPFLSRHLRM